jgi:hypothetical protein
MDHREEALRVEASTVVSKELLEEMVWFFRVEDGKWCGIGVVVFHTKSSLPEAPWGGLPDPIRKHISSKRGNGDLG